MFRSQHRIHLAVGTVCNNNCLFCMERDRESRAVENAAMTPAVVEQLLASHPDAQEVCFTSGEPTTHPDLFQFAWIARKSGAQVVSVMTNGRMLSQPEYAQKLLRAGVNALYVSIHGHTQKLHEGLTRTPGSFAQTVRALDVVSDLKRRMPVRLHSSTVVTRRNLPFLADIYRFLRSHGVEQVVFNVMQPHGRADDLFDSLFPKYTDIASAFARFIREADETRQQQPVMAFLLDIPLCTTEGVANFNRGYVEEAMRTVGDVSYAQRFDTPPDERTALVKPPAGQTLLNVSRSLFDSVAREHRPLCDRCRYRASCEGVWTKYLRRHGWQEFEPVTTRVASL